MDDVSPVTFAPGPTGPTGTTMPLSLAVPSANVGDDGGDWAGMTTGDCDGLAASGDCAGTTAADSEEGEPGRTGDDSEESPASGEDCAGGSRDDSEESPAWGDDGEDGRRDDSEEAPTSGEEGTSDDSEEGPTSRVGAEESPTSSEDGEESRISSDDAEDWPISRDDGEDSRSSMDDGEDSPISRDDGEEAPFSSDDADESRISTEDADESRVVKERLGGKTADGSILDERVATEDASMGDEPEKAPCERRKATVASTNSESGIPVGGPKANDSSASVTSNPTEFAGRDEPENSPETTASEEDGCKFDERDKLDGRISALGCSGSDPVIGLETVISSEADPAAEAKKPTLGVDVGVLVTSAGQSAAGRFGRSSEAVCVPKRFPQVCPTK